MKKEAVNQQAIYVHIDHVINNVATSGISFGDFLNGVGQPPENILLIKHNIEDASYNAHTAFHYLEPNDLANIPKENFSPLCWIDFEDVELLNQLTPQEVAEMLYLAHTGRHLRSPFYYKLQNNFVYLTREDGRYNKIYYRNLNHFYILLSFVIARKTSDLVNEKTFLSFGKKKYVAEPPVELLKKMSDHFRDGACIAFDDVVKTRTQIEVPIGLGLTEEMTELEISSKIYYEQEVAKLVYDLKQNEWNYIEK
ncbi:hypothetical protein [Listeria ivanovii]|uniref:Uncharacterized protein n=2 Tax=Listeria ivanovii TaxID=1638 RepID=A0ABS1G3Q5_LISIV|nr:hypothetical protein [Listeria ivanovii]EFR97617.1 conserved hypothetical protein [Listeria ivanovii FSL F6-596]AIS59274.1 hypothetical protein JL58_04435 [Listeria ivanovii subsp. londoniensis]AIS62108.1 hypothetical protein JL53_04915 [Listeria ivanovii subsp. londoniensis]MBK1961509.1 hypothetical protein [Listeria ivanovii subsp. londoniensis]MBK1965520.1 hypothetical protein [Listeria ivanovii subsp. londoniensis]